MIDLQSIRRTALAEANDPLAHFTLEQVTACGELHRCGAVSEPPSGNTGITLAWKVRPLGNPERPFTRERVSVERRSALEGLGAAAPFTPQNMGIPGAVRVVDASRGATGHHVPDQFGNANAACCPEFTTGTGRPGLGRMVGCSRVMRKVYDLIERVAPTHVNVLILGESGTGKELVAEALHRMSPRASMRFLAVNCGAVAHDVIESELFGHERGSFTGADRRHKGYFEEANGGTLFLDEITEMPPGLQVKLLRVLDTGSFFRVGASEPMKVNVRVLATTNRDPERAVRDGKLREDLYYRLSAFPIALPALRERGEDIDLIAMHFLDAYNQREGTDKRWSDAALRHLREYDWPGNVRELRNVVERAAILSEETIETRGIPGEDRASSDENETVVRIDPGTSLDSAERLLILATVRMLGGDKKEAARRLGISVKTLYNRLNVFEAAGLLVRSRPGAA